MTHSLPPLDTEDLTPWYEEAARERKLGLWVLIGLNIAIGFVGFCIGWTLTDIVMAVLK